MDNFTFTHLSSDNYELEAQKKAGRKRPRVRNALSCYQCRSRKIRCNRDLPCKPCAERGDGDRCTYKQTKTTTSSASKSISPESQEATADETRQRHTNGKAPIAQLQKSRHTSLTIRSPIAASDSQPQGMQTAPDSTREDAQSPQTAQSSPADTLRRPFIGHIIQRSNRKTRLVGVSYWMAPCNEMIVIKKLVARSQGFQDSMKELAVLKERLRLANAVSSFPPLSTIDNKSPTAILFSVLPDRPTCEQWIGRFFQSYGRIYDIVDTSTLATDLYQAFYRPANAKHSYATALDSIYILRILIVTALGMQMSEPHRLQGRSLGRVVEDFIHMASRVHKPCIGSVQVLLLLFLLKTVTASDSDGEYDSMGLFGLTSHVISSMGLQRDPALFDITSPYHSEQRKRLWACYMRLSLTYCIRTGTQLLLRLEDVDCPFPSPSVIKDPSTNATLDNDIQSCAHKWDVGDSDTRNDAKFSYTYAKLANIMAPVHQTLCSAKPLVTVEQQKTLNSSFTGLMAELSSSLQSGTSLTDPMVKLQRALLFVGMHSYMLVVSLNFILRHTTDELVASGDFAAQRPLLLETWDYTTSILNQFETVCKQPTSSDNASDNGHSDASTIAHHLMWADAGRAALTGCLIVGRLRRHDIDKAMPFSETQQQHSTLIFQHVLTQFLTVLLETWRSKSHLGPVTAKSSMVIAVAIAVTNNLYADYDGIFEKGVEAANHLIADMKSSLDQRLSERDSGSRIRDSGISMDDAVAAAAAVKQASSSAQSPQDVQSQTGIRTTIPLPIMTTTMSGISTNITAPILVPQQAFALSSAQLWPPAPPLVFDNQPCPAQTTDLSVAGSSTGSQTTTPDFNNIAGFIGQDYIPDMSFPYAMTNNVNAECAWMEDFDSTLFDFSGDTVMNMNMF